MAGAPQTSQSRKSEGGTLDLFLHSVPLFAATAASICCAVFAVLQWLRAERSGETKVEVRAISWRLSITAVRGIQYMPVRPACPPCTPAPGWSRPPSNFQIGRYMPELGCQQLLPLCKCSFVCSLGHYSCTGDVIAVVFSGGSTSNL